jgi:hypothetical protein
VINTQHLSRVAHAVAGKIPAAGATPEGQRERETLHNAARLPDTLAVLGLVIRCNGIPGRDGRGSAGRRGPGNIILREGGFLNFDAQQGDAAPASVASWGDVEKVSPQRDSDAEGSNATSPCRTPTPEASAGEKGNLMRIRFYRAAAGGGVFTVASADIRRT